MSDENPDQITVANQHTASCGRLRPVGSNFAYFEKSIGEQWVLLATKDSVILAGGDLGWARVRRLENPDWRAVDTWLVPPLNPAARATHKSWPGLVLETAESAWLLVAVRAASEKLSR